MESPTVNDYSQQTNSMIRERVHVGFVCDRHYDELFEVTVVDCGGDGARLSDLTTAAPTKGFADLVEYDDLTKEDSARLATYVFPTRIAVPPSAAERDMECPPSPRVITLSRDVIERQYSERRAAGGPQPLVDPLLATIKGVGSGGKVAVRGAASPEAAVGDLASHVERLTWHCAQMYEDLKALQRSHATLMEAHASTVGTLGALQAEHGALQEAHNTTLGELTLLRAASDAFQQRALPLVEEVERKEREAAAAKEATVAAVIKVLAEDDADSLLERLVTQTRDVNVADDDGWTPLHVAAKNGATDVVKALIAAGANVSAVDHYGRTPLHRAANNGHLAVARALIDAHPTNINATDVYGKTAHSMALLHAHVDIQRLLEASGAAFALGGR